jgi:hypothetical protein
MSANAQHIGGEGSAVLGAAEGLVKGVWWMGLGLVALTGRGAGRVVQALMDAGREFEPKVSQGIRTAEESATEMAGSVGAQIWNVAGKIMPERSETAEEKLPTREEIHAIQHALEELKRELAEIRSSKSGTAPAGPE